LPFEWDQGREEAFLELKKPLTSTYILMAPSNEGTCILDTDGSEFAHWAMLQQEQDGQLRVIAYASRALT